MVRCAQALCFRYTRSNRAAYEVFSRAQKVMQRTRAATDIERSRQVDYIRTEVAKRMVERLAFVKRRFESVLDLGAGAGLLERAICAENSDAQAVRSRILKMHMVDSCKEVLFRDADQPYKGLEVEREVADEETYFPGVATQDAVLSSMSLHWINDLPGVLKRIESMLKPDGLFMASMVGGDSLYELRTSLQLAEMERYGRVTPRLSPLADVRDMGGLMQQAGFQLLTIDVDDIIVMYPDMFALLDDLKQSGESNAIKLRPATITRELLQAANAIYTEMHGDGEGVSATFRVIFMIGWRHSPDQPKPLDRGSADQSLKDILK